MAGIMGGEGSGVIGAEYSHTFSSKPPSSLLSSWRGRHGSMVYTRMPRIAYERGVDPELAYRQWSGRHTLLLDCVGGEAGPVTDVSSPADLPERELVISRAQRSSRCWGSSLPQTEITRIFQALGFRCRGRLPTLGHWSCTAPSWRFDMGREADLIEEIARMYGYDNIPCPTPASVQALRVRSRVRNTQTLLKQRLIARGFNEAITFSFVSPESAAVD